MIRLNRPTCPNPRALATNYKHPTNKEALVVASYGKCMYCECKIMHTSFGDVEHIRPKSKYPALKFEWSNLGLCCGRCNVSKLDKFDEANQYINPYEEVPSEHIDSVGVFLSAKNKRGEITIQDIQLNRPPLVERRKEKMDVILKLLTTLNAIPDQAQRADLMSFIKTLAEEDKELSFFVNSWIIQVADPITPPAPSH